MCTLFRFSQIFTFLGRCCELLSVVYILECELGKPEEASLVMGGRSPEASVRPELEAGICRSLKPEQIESGNSIPQLIGGRYNLFKAKSKEEVFAKGGSFFSQNINGGGS